MALVRSRAGVALVVRDVVDVVGAAVPGDSPRINELGAVYLSGARWTQLAQAGLVKELRSGAAFDADSLFEWPVGPWCAFMF